MKKAILAPLCSAFVIPGLGQVVNQHLKKGVIMLAIVFLFILTITYELYQLIKAVIKPGFTGTEGAATIMDRIMVEEPVFLGVLLMAFAVLWIYSVVDAFIGGWKADNIVYKESKYEKLPDR